MKIKKNKILLLFLFFILQFKMFPSEIKVRIEVPIKKSLQLKKFDKIIFQKYILKFTDKNIKIEYENLYKNFIINDFKKAVSKETLYIDDTIIDSKTDFKVSDKIIIPDNIKENFKHSLIVSLNTQLKRDERHIISEETDKYGDKKKHFVKKSVWNLKTKIYLIDINSSKIIRIYNFDKTLNEDKETTEQFNFKYLFDKTMEKFIRKILKKEKVENRYLLTQINKKPNLFNMRKG